MDRQLLHSLTTYSDGSYDVLRAQEIIPPVPNLFVVRWDDELTEYNYMSRTAAPTWGWGRQTPAVFRFFPVMREDAGDFRVNLETVEAFTHVINPTDKLWDYYTGHSAGIFNTHDVPEGESSGWPKQMYVVMSGNYLKGLEIVGNWLKFETLTVPQMAPEGAGELHLTHPHHVHHWSVVGINAAGLTTHAEIVNAGVVHYPCVSKEGFGFIPMRYVRAVPNV